jgi:hypothetical protein
MARGSGGGSEGEWSQLPLWTIAGGSVGNGSSPAKEPLSTENLVYWHQAYHQCVSIKYHIYDHVIILLIFTHKYT